MDTHDTPQQPGPDDAVPLKSTNQTGWSSNRRRQTSDAWQVSSLLGLINGAIVSVGGVFVATSSVVITLIASVVALLAALMITVKN
ncbi:hypothetical protein AB0L65_16510 [Nonomuraea sp. NPDC052116]|uniref:hypothetical protein n=1 Tax=Nonomuraea sp. NPDC052116 TaxID=3155665 RepID=UPI003428351E